LGREGHVNWFFLHFGHSLIDYLIIVLILAILISRHHDFMIPRFYYFIISRLQPQMIDLYVGSYQALNKEIMIFYKIDYQWINCLLMSPIVSFKAFQAHVKAYNFT